MSTLPLALYTAEQTRQLDKTAIEHFEIPGFKLMKRAGAAVFNAITQRWDKQQLTVFCGAGNNGGDGYIIAGLAKTAGWPVDIYYLSDPNKLSGDASLAFQFARDRNVPVHAFDAEQFPEQGIIVDALLGTGISGEVRDCYVQAITKINDSDNPVVAVDIPSGLSADTGMTAGVAINAALTVTFIGMKQGLLTGDAVDHCGELIFDALEVPDDVYPFVRPSSHRLNYEELMSALPRRSRSAHKGHYGHVLVIGGDTGYGGAVMMAAEAAIRTGAGLVSVATKAEHIAPLLSRTPAVMARAVANNHDLQPLIETASVVVIGPGLGQSTWSEQMLQCALESGLPLVIDADALNLISGKKIDKTRQQLWIMTPHPGEAARLLQQTVAQVQRDRFAAAKQIQKKYAAAVLLKGAGSITCSTSRGVGVSNSGNPGMASGGMGDVLSGIIGGLLSQQVPPEVALELGVCIHGKAADLASKAGERGMTATDLYPYIRTLVNG